MSQRSSGSPATTPADDQASDAATAYRRGDSAGYYQAEAEGKRLEKRASELAKAYGFRVCYQLGS
jgi:hypothetical protein